MKGVVLLELQIASLLLLMLASLVSNLVSNTLRGKEKSPNLPQILFFRENVNKEISAKNMSDLELLENIQNPFGFDADLFPNVKSYSFKIENTNIPAIKCLNIQYFDAVEMEFSWRHCKAI